MSTLTSKSGSRRLQLRCAIERRNTLVQTHRDLVRPIALHYGRCSREGYEDLLQVGLLGLIRAAELFDQQQGTPFTAFARPHIRGAILHHLRDVAPTVRLPRRQAELQERLVKLERQSLAEGRQASPELLQRTLGIDACQWGLLMRHRQLNRPASLSELPWETLELVAEEDEAATSSDGGPEPAQMAALLETLEPRQRLVVQQVVLGGVSYRQLARTMAVSPMTVQRLLHRGLERLRSRLEEQPVKMTLGAGPAQSAVPGC